jgi:hypothetical protein
MGHQNCYVTHVIDFFIVSLAPYNANLYEHMRIILMKIRYGETNWHDHTITLLNTINVSKHYKVLLGQIIVENVWYIYTTMFIIYYENIRISLKQIHNF